VQNSRGNPTTSITLVVVGLAVPEGLPLAATLALAFATKRMTAENLLVQILSSCESMANASVVCTDKTGTLTQNVMSVVAGLIGIHTKFVRNLKDKKGTERGYGLLSGSTGSLDFVMCSNFISGTLYFMYLEPIYLLEFSQTSCVPF